MVAHSQSASSSVVERCPDKTEVEGSIPSSRTNVQHGSSASIDKLSGLVPTRVRGFHGRALLVTLLGLELLHK